VTTRKLITTMVPGLNTHAVERMVVSIRLQSLRTEAHIRAYIKTTMAEADAEARNIPIPSFDGVALMNDSADELAYEARAS